MSLATRAVRVSLCLALAGAIYLALGAAPARAQSGVWTTFAINEGLTGENVTALARTDTNSIVLGVKNTNLQTLDVLVYDGIRFDTLSTRYATPPDLAGSVSSTITGLALAPDGDVWVGVSDNGVWRLGPSSYDHFTEIDGLGDRRSRNVTALVVDDTGTVWAGMQTTGLSRYDGAQWTSLTIQDGLASESVRDLELGLDGELWIALLDFANGGLTRFDGSTFNNYQRPGAPVSESAFISLAVQPEGTVWAGGALSGLTLFRSDGTWLRNFGTSDGLLSGTVNDVAVGPFGDIWIGAGSQGAQRWNGSVWESFNPSNSGIAASLVRTVLLDDSGAIWFGTTLGASRFQGSRFLVFDDGGDLPNNEVTGLSRVPGSPPSPGGVGVTRGPLYLSVNQAPGQPSSRDGGALLWDQLAFTEVEESAGIPLDRELLGISSFAGGAWSVDPDTLYEIEGTQLVRSVAMPAFVDPGERFSSVLAHSSGDIWVGTRPGGGIGNSLVLRFNGTSWDLTTIPELSGIEAGVYVHDEDADGWIWASFDPGTNATRFDPVSRTVELFGIADGLPAGSTVRDIHVAGDGAVYLATSAGVVRYDGAVFQPLPTQGLLSTIVHTVGVDQAGRVWAGTAAGVAYFQGLQWSPYGTVDGLPGDQVVHLLADTSEAILGTERAGLALFHRDAAPPRAQFLFGPPALIGQRSVASGYVGGDLNSLPVTVELATRLDGGVRSPFSTQNTLQASGLADGVHVLEVWARDRALNESATPARYEFEIDATPPQPRISSPLFGRPVEGQVPIFGDIADERFGGYRVRVRPSGAADWDTLVLTDQMPPTDELATWNTLGLDDGPFDVELVVVDTLDLRGWAVISVIVDNEDPKNEVTSPARVVSQEGGHIFTLNAEVELYFPPNALTEDRIITIQPAAIPSDLPPGASRALGAWRITPDDLVPKKPVTLTFSLAGLDSAGQANGGPVLQLSKLDAAAQSGNAQVGVFVVRPDSTQEYLGGSLDVLGGTLTTSNAQLGTYVVYEGLFQTVQAGEAKDIDIQPRAFSPTGSTFDEKAAISFNVGGSGNVRVYAYNRAGRIVRRVFEGSLPPGRNVIYWDGRDGRGAIVPSGLYLIAVDAEGETDVKSVAVVNR